MIKLTKYKDTWGTMDICPCCDGKGRIERATGYLMNSPNSVFELIQPKIKKQNVESFFVLAVDTKHRITHLAEVTRGLIDSTLIAPRELFTPLIKAGAYAFIMAHNHPSNDPKPSQADLQTTKKIIQASQIMQIECLDHIIISRSSYYSMRECDNWLWRNKDVIEG